MKLTVLIDAGQRVAVGSLEEASEACGYYLDKTGIGASDWGGGRVTDAASGKAVARIAYNGNVIVKGGSKR